MHTHKQTGHASVFLHMGYLFRSNESALKKVINAVESFKPGTSACCFFWFVFFFNKNIKIKPFVKKNAATYCAIQLRINLCLYKLRWIHVVGGVMSQHNHCLTLNTEDTVQS